MGPTPLSSAPTCAQKRPHADLEARLRMERFPAGLTTMSAYERLPLTSGSQGGNYSLLSAAIRSILPACLPETNPAAPGLRAGLLLSAVLIDFIVALNPTLFPRMQDIGVNWAGAAFTVSLGGIAIVGFGIRAVDRTQSGWVQPSPC